MTLMQKPLFSRLVLLVLALACLQVNAQDASSPDEEDPVVPTDEFDRGTPLRSENGFLAAANMGDYETAAEYLDLRNLRGKASRLTGAQLARRLGVIVQRGVWVEMDELVDDPAGRRNDNLPDYRDSAGVIVMDGRDIRLLMQKVPRDEGVSIWKISNATVSLIPELYEAYGYPELIETLRRNLPDVSFLGYELFKWVILLGVAILAYGVVFLIAIAIRKTLTDLHTLSQQRLFDFLTIPTGIWVVIISVNAAATSLGRSETAEAWGQLSPVTILVTVWFLFTGMSLVRDVYLARLQYGDRSGSILLHTAANATKVIIALCAVLIYLDKLGVNVITVMAGLGVDGISVALALQKPLEDVFGALTIYALKPIKVGDFCRIGNRTGTIEEIGLRTTRVRTLANTLIMVPNAQLANEPIDNISARKKIWYRPFLRLRYDTTPEQLQQILEGIRSLLSSDEQVLQDNHRVRLKEIAEDALVVEVYAYLATTDWAEYLEIAEGLNIQILKIVSQAGTSLYPPARAVQLDQGAIDIPS